MRLGGSRPRSGLLLYGDALHPIARLDAQHRLAQLYVFRDGAHTPTAMVAYTYTGEDVTRTTFGFVTDPRGSVRLVVDLDDGAVVQRIDYGAFGEVILDSSPGFQPFGYAGGIYDADTGLVRFGARDYDAETGRWLTRDPIGFGGGDTNLYAYVGGDPVNFVDPTGLIVNVCRRFGPGGADHWYVEFVTDGSTAQFSALQWWRMETESDPSGVCLPFPATESCARRAASAHYEWYWLFVNDCRDAVFDVLNECMEPDSQLERDNDLETLFDAEPDFGFQCGVASNGQQGCWVDILPWRLH